MPQTNSSDSPVKEPVASGALDHGVIARQFYTRALVTFMSVPILVEHDKLVDANALLPGLIETTIHFSAFVAAPEAVVVRCTSTDNAERLAGREMFRTDPELAQEFSGDELLAWRKRFRGCNPFQNPSSQAICAAPSRILI